LVVRVTAKRSLAWGLAADSRVFPGYCDIGNLTREEPLQ